MPQRLPDHQSDADVEAAALDERRRTTRTEVEEGARRHFRLRAGVAAMEQALRL